MSGDVLSQAEVESLLTAMSDDETDEASKAAAPSAPTVSPSISPIAIQRQEKISPYDFKRPERLSKDQMRGLQTLHEGFGRNFAASLSAMLRSMVHVKLTSVDELPYSEYVFSLENPACLNILKAEPLEGNMVLDYHPIILYPVIDRLLGGGKEAGSFTRRPLTDIESRLVSRITTLFLRELEHAWENILELHCEVVRMESNPQLVQIVPPNESVVLISFELALTDEIRGIINLCIPYNSIERISGNLSANQWAASGSREAPPESAERIGNTLRSSLVELKVQLAQTRITTGQLISLRVGDIITTEKAIHDPLLVSVEEIPKFQASPGEFKSHKAVRIEDVLKNQDDAIQG